MFQMQHGSRFALLEIMHRNWLFFQLLASPNRLRNLK